MNVKAILSIAGKYGDLKVNQLSPTAVAEIARAAGVNLSETVSGSLATMLSTDDAHTVADYLAEPKRFQALMAKAFAKGESGDEQVVRCPHCAELFTLN